MNKIAFITCVSDNDLYNTCVKYINKLHIPSDTIIETIRISNPSSMTSGYNKGMQETDAKYKVYLHQDLYILNKNFIQDILTIFSNRDTGMLGVIGAKKIPRCGVWWESLEKVGQIYDTHLGRRELLNFTTQKENELVEVIDGCIIVTQYDLPWREEVFDGWHFYDLSQCVEFRKKGYKIVIPFQTSTWCFHDCGIVNLTNYEKDRIKFLTYYSKDINKKE